MFNREADIVKDRDSEIESIRAKAEWTEEAKQGRIAAVREVAREEVLAVREEEKQQRETNLLNTKRAVYEVPAGQFSSDAEKAQILLGYRAARNDVRAATEASTPEEFFQVGDKLADLLDQAELTGDSQLARAVYHHSIEAGVDSVRDRYLDRRPQDRAKFEAFTKAQAEMDASQSFEHLFAAGLTQQAL